MTDFVDDLERELVAAARRGSAPRHRLLWRPSPKPFLAVATAIAAILVVAVLTRPDERPVPSRPQPAVVAPPATGPEVLVVNETGIEGLAGVTRDELYVRFRLDIAVDGGRVTSRKRTVVRSGAASEPLARKIADALDARLELDGQLRPVEGRTPQVLVLLGRDRMR